MLWSHRSLPPHSWWVTMCFLPLVVDDMWWNILILPRMGQQCILTDYFIVVFCKPLGNAISGAPNSQTLKFLCKTNSVNTFHDHILVLPLISVMLGHILSLSWRVSKWCQTHSVQRQLISPVPAWLWYIARSEHYPHNEAYFVPGEIQSEFVHGSWVLVGFSPLVLAGEEFAFGLVTRTAHGLRGCLLPACEIKPIKGLTQTLRLISRSCSFHHCLQFSAYFVCKMKGFLFQALKNVFYQSLG